MSTLLFTYFIPTYLPLYLLKLNPSPPWSLTLLYCRSCHSIFEIYALLKLSIEIYATLKFRHKFTIHVLFLAPPQPQGGVTTNVCPEQVSKVFSLLSLSISLSLSTSHFPLKYFIFLEIYLLQKHTHFIWIYLNSIGKP